MHPTSDGVVPAAWFVALLAVLPAREARESLRAVQDTAHGIALAMAGDKERFKVQSATRRLKDAAYPMLYDESPEETPDGE